MRRSVLQQGGYPSAAIAPLEVFHSGGVLWHSLRGETEQPRFRVRTASIDGAPVNTLCSLGLTPELAIKDVKHTDVIIVAASGHDVMDEIAQNTGLLPWLRRWHSRGAYIAGICSGVGFLAKAGILHWPPSNYALGHGRSFSSALSESAVGTRAICNGRRPSIVQRRCVRLDRSQPVPRNQSFVVATSHCNAPSPCSSACRAAGNPDTRSCPCPVRIPTTGSHRASTTCSNTSSVNYRSTLSPVA